MRTSRSLWGLTGACLLALIASPALALPVIYSGYDAGSASLATSPNATAAAAAFDANFGGLPVIDFESGLPAGVGMSFTNITDTSGCPPALCGYNTTSGGSDFQLQVGGLSPSLTFTFADPIYAFGAYFTGWQVGTQTLVYSDGTITVLNMPGANFDTGGTLFYGFVDAGKKILSVTYNQGIDIVAVDDVRYAPVPEPSTLLLLGAGLLGAGRRLSRRK